MCSFQLWITGIAANLLLLGRTFHSRLKAPLNPDQESTLQISAQSKLADLIRGCKVMLIDEATMLDKFQLEAMNRTLQDICSNERAFGGKIVILAGDFRQCLPVVQGGSRKDIVSHCINQSMLWKEFQLMRLSVNMRVHASGDQMLEEFDEWLLQIGNGETSSLTLPREMIATEIEKNSKENPNAEGQAMRSFCETIFPNIEVNIENPEWLEGRAILASTNKEVDTINETLQEKIPGEMSVSGTNIKL